MEGNKVEGRARKGHYRAEIVNIILQSLTLTMSSL
jgi:hypothetical protein